MAHKRAQAALEFLSTYGFAFLIILVMVGALTYFGVLRPERLIPNRCTFPADVGCFEYQVDSTPPATATLNIQLTNNLGTTIEFNQAATASFANSTYGNGPCTTLPTSGIAGGSRTLITCVMNVPPVNWPPAGEKAKIAVNLQYRELGRNYWVPVQGEVLATLI